MIFHFQELNPNPISIIEHFYWFIIIKYINVFEIFNMKNSIITFSTLTSILDKISSEDHQMKSRENSVEKFIQTVTKNIQKSNKADKKSLIVEKEKITSNKGTQSFKKKTVFRKINNK